MDEAQDPLEIAQTGEMLRKAMSWREFNNLSLEERESLEVKWLISESTPKNGNGTSGVPASVARFTGWMEKFDPDQIPPFNLVIRYSPDGSSRSFLQPTRPNVTLGELEDAAEHLRK